MTKQVWLTVDDVCNVENKKKRNVLASITRGALKAEKVKTNRRCGFEYRIKLSDLSEAAKVRYYASQKEKYDDTDNNQEEKYEFSNLTDKQKEKAYLWKGVLDAWREYVDEYNGNDTNATKEYIKIYNKKGEVKLSERTLYRKWKMYKEYGIVALADYRGVKNVSGNDIPDEAWEIFSNWYLDIKKPKVAFLYKALNYHYEMNNPQMLPLPSESTFRRAIQSRLPVSVIKYFRDGKKVWTDECAYYLRRDYSLLNSNDVWTSDYHTLDLFVKDDVTGEVYRPHLIIWSDIKSRKILTMKLRRSSDSHGVFLTFRSAVKEYGAPDMVYLDNGREFLSSDIGGRGRRKTDENADYGQTLFDRLGIKMVNAKVANGRAKIAERQFKTMTDQFSRMFETYCGNKPTTRPEGHKKILKNEKNIPLLSEVEKELQDYFEGYYNNIESKAVGLENGTPNECYKKYLFKKRTLPLEQLNEILLRTTKMQTYKRSGVYVSISNTQIYFYNSNITMDYLGKKVYVRYDPDDLSEVIIEDDKGRYVGKAQRVVSGGYDMANDIEAIKYVNKTNKKLEKIIKDYKAVENMSNIPHIRQVISEKSKQLIQDNKQQYYTNVIEPILNPNTSKRVVGAENVDTSLIDFERMIANAKKKKEKSNEN